MAPSFETLDSGERQNYDSGMRRDLQDGKPNFHLIMAADMPYEEQLVTRWAALMERGAIKYGNRNWELANSSEELERFKASAFRHMIQGLCGEADEDHWAAVCFNINAIVYTEWKLEQLDDNERSSSEQQGSS